MSITPGPNNAMLASSGLTFGVRRTLPHLMGVNLGCGLMVLALGLGLGTVFAREPVLYQALKYVGAAYLLGLAWKIAHAEPPSEENSAARGQPLTFAQALLFQWVNPKAYVMTAGLIAAYTPQRGFFGNLLLTAVVCSAVNMPCTGLWMLCGSVLRRWLHRPAAVRIFNIVMALLLVISLYPVARELARQLT
jgi:threonine/homoserine/homoserine lactone efflux protein